MVICKNRYSLTSIIFCLYSANKTHKQTWRGCRACSDQPIVGGSPLGHLKIAIRRKQLIYSSFLS